VPSYPVPARQATAELRERGSRFLALVGPVAGEDEAGALVAALARGHPGATHLCWARRLGWPPRERSADAGEPAGTAGAPMLMVLRGAGISDVCAVVVRWFGGVKLGKGGLARAYAGAVRAALAEMPLTRRVARVRLELAVPLARLGAVKRLIHPPEVVIESERYPGDGAAAPAPGHAEIVLHAAEESRPRLEERLAELGVSVRPAPPADPGVGPPATGAIRALGAPSGPIVRRP
jgi:uncharacterized YigZ family protein